MPFNFLLDWIERYAAGEKSVLGWYPCGLDEVTSHAGARGDGEGFSEKEREEWRGFLEPHNPTRALLKNLDRLASPESRVVVTGQQAGLFGGPMYTVLKATAAIRWARELEGKLGKPVVPVFWLASDDHDFAEVAGVAWHDGQGMRRTWEAAPRDGLAGHPVYQLPLGDKDLASFRAAFEEGTPPTDYRRAILDLVDRIGRLDDLTWESQCVHCLVDWFGEEGLVPVAPRLNFMRYRARGVMRHEIETGPAPAGLVKDSGSSLGEVGAKEYVLHRSGNEANFFLHLETGRHKVVWMDQTARAIHPVSGAEAGSWTRREMLRELERHPDIFSPNAALRPVVQDAVLPNLAYVGGPAEVLYHAQIKPLYEEFGVFRPAILPRPRAVLIPPRVWRLLGKLGLDLEACLKGGAEFVERESARVADDSGFRETLCDRIDDARSALEQLAATVFEETKDTGLKRAAESLTESFEKGASKLVDRADQFLARRHSDVTNQAGKVSESLWPNGAPQERALSALSPLLLLGGPEAPRELLARIDHRATHLQPLDLRDFAPAGA